MIVGARLGERAHIDDNARLCAFQLSADDRAELEAAIATLTPIPGDCGDEYRTPPFLTASGDLSHHLDTLPAALRGAARAARHAPVLQRHAVGATGRLLARGARRPPHQRVGHDGHARAAARSAAPIRPRRRTS